MSKAKFAAAKELIQEKQYDAAREVLKTLQHPTAHKWLKKIDDLDPPFPANARYDSEQQQYYKRQNRKAKRRAIFSDIDLILYGAGTLGLWGMISGIFFGQPIVTAFSEWNLLLFTLSILLVLFGIFRLITRK